MSLQLITVCENIPSEHDEIIVAEAAKPWLAKAGYIHISEAQTAAIHAMLARLPQPVLPNLEDAA